MRTILMGATDFKEIREKGMFYIDKTSMIDEMLTTNVAKVHLITRPRRFGKSLNLSMLDAYFNIRYRGNSWFDGLEISELRPDDQHKNAYPVIYLDIKNLDGSSRDAFIESLRLAIQKICLSYLELKDSEKIDAVVHDQFIRFLEKSSTEQETLNSLCFLSSVFTSFFGRKAIIIIDEYDNLVNNATSSESRRQILDLIRSILSPALKGNDDLEFAVLTGVMQITKESIFSGLNNLIVSNITSSAFSDCAGFTEAEVRSLCEEYGKPEKFDEIRYWYDGYRFGGREIYNPWSVLSYVYNGFVPATYWGGTSGNSIIGDLLSRTSQLDRENMMALANGGYIQFQPEPAVTFDQLNNGSAIYSILAVSGYLTSIQEEGRPLLKIPNKEMCIVFAKEISERMCGSSDTIERFVSSMLRGGYRGDVVQPLQSYEGFH